MMPALHYEMSPVSLSGRETEDVFGTRLGWCEVERHTGCNPKHDNEALLNLLDVYGA